MIDCKCFLDDLCDCLDGAADVPVRARFDAHLLACPRCRVIWDTTRSTLYLYKRVCVCRVPPEVEARLMAALETMMDGEGRWRDGPRPA